MLNLISWDGKVGKCFELDERHGNLNIMKGIEEAILNKLAYWLLIINKTFMTIIKRSNICSALYVEINILVILEGKFKIRNSRELLLLK